MCSCSEANLIFQLKHFMQYFSGLFYTAVQSPILSIINNVFFHVTSLTLTIEQNKKHINKKIVSAWQCCVNVKFAISQCSHRYKTLRAD